MDHTGLDFEYLIYRDEEINPLNDLLNSGQSHNDPVTMTTPNSVPSTTPTVTTNNLKPPTAHGSKRTRTSVSPRHVFSRWSHVTAHDQNAAKKKRNDNQPMIPFVPHGSSNLSSMPKSSSSMISSRQLVLSNDLPQDTARNNAVIFSTPLGLAPSMTREQGPESEIMQPDLANQLGEGTFQYGTEHLDLMPNLLLQVATTGTPSVNSLLQGTYQTSKGNDMSLQGGQQATPQGNIELSPQRTPYTRPQGTQPTRPQGNFMHSPQGKQDVRPQGTQEVTPPETQEQRLRGTYDLRQDTQDLFLDDFNLNNTPSPMRKQNSGLDLLQRDNTPWDSGIDPTKAQEAHVIPHIVYEGDSPLSSREIDAASPLSTTSTGYTSYRGPRSPKIQHITRASSPNASCEVLNPRREYNKNQKKFLQGPRRSEQRVQCGVVHLRIMTKIPLSDSPVEVYVKRDPKAAHKLCQEHPDEYTMEETRIPEIRLFTNEKTTDANYSFCYRCELDLDSVYLTADGKKEVYKLVKSKGAINNLFQISITLSFNNGFKERLMPYEFVLKSGRTPAQDINVDNGLGIREAIGPKSHVSCRHLQAETAKITNIHCEYIQTDNHDIAYFMKVRCEDEEKPNDLERGDVVAFLEDNEGDTYIDFLTTDNAKDARLAGVISRTAFFRGRKAICDPDHVDSDLVCIIGEVDVKVHGKVHAGDLIYTSDCILRRGTAVARNPRDPEIQFDDPDSPRPTLLGMAMESYDDVEIKLVRCLVSIILGISDLHQRQTLDELRKCRDKILKIQKYLKGVWKKLLLVLLFLLVAGTLCYVFLAPKSPYLIMKCEDGCVKRGDSCLYLNIDYFPHESQEVDEIVGIHFKWKKLKKKLNLNFSKFTNKTDLYYYLNKSRCVTGNIRAISSWLDTTPQVPRVNVLAVNKDCTDVYYYSVRDGWVAYDRSHFHIKRCEQ